MWVCGCLARCFCTVMDSKAFLGVCCLSAYDTWTSADEYTTYTITTTKTNKINTKSKLMCTGKGGAFPLHLNEDSLDFVHDGLCLLPLADLREPVHCYKWLHVPWNVCFRDTRTVCPVTDEIQERFFFPCWILLCGAHLNKRGTVEFVWRFTAKVWRLLKFHFQAMQLLHVSVNYRKRETTCSVSMSAFKHTLQVLCLFKKKKSYISFYLKRRDFFLWKNIYDKAC